MSKREKKRDRIREDFQNVESDIFRTERDLRLEKARRKKALSRFDRRESKSDLRGFNDETRED